MRNASRWTLVGLLLALASANVVYRLILFGRLEQTAALFIGLPTFLAIGFALAVRPRSPTGMIMAGMTIALLMSGPFLGEGFICILMAAPLFYLIGWIVGSLITAIGSWGQRQQHGEEQPGGRVYVLVLLPFLLMSLEGTHEWLSLPREETVIVSRVVSASAEEVREALAATPRFDRELPLYLRLGFPRPLAASGSGLGTGDRRVINFSGPNESTRFLTLQVVQREQERAVFQAVSDGSAIARWLTWKEAEVQWLEVETGRTQVDWTLRYERRLDPAWYFGPFERYAVGLAASYLIDTVATPRVERSVG